MAEADACFGIYTPYGEERHYSNYFSFFGQDLAAGETASARARLVVATEPGEADILAMAEAFAASR